MTQLGLNIFGIFKFFEFFWSVFEFSEIENKMRKNK